MRRPIPCVLALVAAFPGWGCADGETRTAEPAVVAPDAAVPVAGSHAPESTGTSAGGADAGMPADLATPDPDPAAALFAPERLLEIDVELDAGDWDALRAQGRSLLDIFGGDDCQAAPHDKPFTYFPASITVDGVRVDRAGLRKKGFFGSLDHDKPSLKIDFGELVSSQTLNGVRRMTLNNAKQDASHLNQCVAYALFRDAGVPVPRCNFARVSVNGESLGVYVNVEPIKKPFLRQHFASDSGNLYEGTLSDFRAGWTGTFEQKTNEVSDPSRADIQAVVEALSAGGDPRAAVAELVDLDEFVNFWAVESLAGHIDGYAHNANNFYVYGDPDSGRFAFIPWGADQLFDNGEKPSGGEVPVVMTQGTLAGALYADAEGRSGYVARIRELLDDTWRVDERLADVERMRRLIAPHVPAGQLTAFADGVARLERFLRERPAQVMAQLEQLPPTPSEPRDSICFQTLGELSGSFSTQWNSLDNAAVDPRGFTATLSPMLDGFAYAPAPGGLSIAVAGVDADSDGPSFDAAIVSIVEQQDGSKVLVVISTARARLAPGTLAIDHQTTRGIVARQVGDQEPTLVGIVADGELVLEQAGTGDGAAIVGRFSGSVYDAGALLGRN